MRQGYNKYTETLHRKTQNAVVEMITVVRPQLDIDTADDYSKIGTQICSQKVIRFFFGMGIFLFTDNDHDIIVEEIIRIYRNEYDNNFSNLFYQNSE